VGRLVAVDDIEAMAQNILELLSDGSVRQHFGEKARERARDFSVHRNVSAYGALLARLLEEFP
jgi:glycosyltransferase involved in cell wall biosynthesis